VAAVFKEYGFESHGVLVLTGPQGLGKTSWVKRLVPASLGVILVGAVLDPSNKDSVGTAVGHWLVELGELDGTFRKADIARLKSFITLPTDKLRRPYDRLDSEYQRRTVFFASVNEPKYLVDESGNRRWWSVSPSFIDYKHDIDMQQVWAELLTHFERGEQWWLTQDEDRLLSQLNEEHEAVDPVLEMILRAFDWEKDTMRTNEMTATEVLLSLGFDKPQKAAATHCSSVLRKLTGKEPKKKANGRFFALPRRIRGQAHSDDGAF
jgi:putative DNA primase/helicase